MGALDQLLVPAAIPGGIRSGADSEERTGAIRSLISDNSRRCC